MEWLVGQRKGGGGREELHSCTNPSLPFPICKNRAGKMLPCDQFFLHAEQFGKVLYHSLSYRTEVRVQAKGKVLCKKRNQLLPFSLIKLKAGFSLDKIMQGVPPSTTTNLETKKTDFGSIMAWNPQLQCILEEILRLFLLYKPRCPMPRGTQKLPLQLFLDNFQQRAFPP